MMYIGECKIDSRGRVILPKVFLKANDISNGTKVKFQTIQGQNNTIKLVFVEDWLVTDPSISVIHEEGEDS
jgi:bifunctional DNA-binding transcriptional regulator/antitoxin component of YhaV-PrlF toxin-antitoxin module